VLRSFTAIRHALERQETTCSELVEQYLQNIESQAHLNVFLAVHEEEARKKAKEIDRKLQAGTAGKLAGMVLGIKDVICHAGAHTRAGSKILEGFVSPYSATAVARILAEDAIIIGRQNCDEFGMGSSNEHSAFGATVNSHGTNRVPGGSSGASAVAVAADMCLASLGSDTGGSVRQPAAFCGVYGTKPTYSRISRYGLIAFASSFDTIGLLTHNLHDAALLLGVMAGADEHDATSSQRAVPDYTQDLKQKGKYRIAMIAEGLESDGVQAEIKQQMQVLRKQLETAGHKVESASLPLADYILPTYYLLTTAEASTNLSRYDGVRYGYRSPNASSLEQMYKASRTEGFGEEVKRRIMLGTFALSASYYDAYFTKAQKVRRLIKEKTESLLQDFDFLISPTAPTTAFEIGKFDGGSAVDMYLADLFTVQASISGIPAVSVPYGHDAQKLPIGVQVMGAAFEEGKLFSFADDIAQIG